MFFTPLQGVANAGKLEQVVEAGLTQVKRLVSS